MATVHCGAVAFDQIQAVVFDKDGTLADSQAFLRTLGQRRARLIDAQVPGVQEPLLMAFGLDRDRLNESGLLAAGTRQENEIAAAAYVAETGQDWADALRIVRLAFIEAEQALNRKAEQTPLIAGALPLLQALATAKVRMGLVSSDTPENVQDFLDCYELGSLIPVAYGSTAALSKPDPALLQKACHALQVSPAHTLVIGDSSMDVRMAQAAQAAGCVEMIHRERKGYVSKANATIAHFAEIRLAP